MYENSGTADKLKSGADTAPPAKSGKGGKKRWPLVLCAVTGALLCAYLGLCAWVGASGRIYPRTTVAGIDYGGLTVEQAAQKLSSCFRGAKRSRVDFELSGGENGESGVIASVPLEDVSAEPDYARAAAELYREANGEAGFLAGGAGYIRALLSPRELVVDDCDEALRAAAETVLNALECEPVEFSAEMADVDLLRITHSMDGRRIPDRERALDTVAAALRRAAFGGSPLRVTLSTGAEDSIYEAVPARTVDLAAEHDKLVGEKVNASYDIENQRIIPSHAGLQFPLSALESRYDRAAPGESFTMEVTGEVPEVTTEQLEEGLFRDELSSYTTRVGGAPGRHKNVKLTAERINGYILNAGDTMKYGPLVTPFSAANGYSPAPGYLRGKTVDMIGGGACQASSTLYAAVLYANLEIVQRVNHGYASDYIGLGLDATVAEGGPEFEFRNNTLYPIKVDAKFFTEKGKDYLKITLLGTKTDDSYVKITSQVLSTTPFEEEVIETDTLAPGERKVEQTAYTGYLVKTYRNVYSGDGTLLSSTYEATSNYRARNRIVLVGKAQPSPDGGQTDAPAGDAGGAPETPAFEPVELPDAEPPAEPTEPIEPPPGAEPD